MVFLTKYRRRRARKVHEEAQHRLVMRTFRKLWLLKLANDTIKSMHAVGDHVGANRLRHKAELLCKEVGDLVQELD